MGVMSIFLINGAFLALLLVVLIIVMLRNGHPKQQNRKVKEDIKRIKDQIIKTNSH